MKAPKTWLSEFTDISKIPNHKFSDLMTFAGNKVESIEIKGGETVFEFEITSNRPDTLSIIGLAREASALFNKPLKLPKPVPPPRSTHNPLKLTIQDSQLCPTYSALELYSVKIKPSSQLIQQRLKHVDIQPVNNVVDITNYLMHQTGQPMHAFDADQIKGNINLRSAKKNETITPLDHKQRTLKGGEIIIEDEEKIIDLAGLMGGLNTEVTNKTKCVYLLVPIYDPVTIRRASITHKLRTPASNRFEKQLDLHQTLNVATQAIAYFKKQASPKGHSRIHSLSSSHQTPIIKLNHSKASQITGHTFSQKNISNYLSKLQIKDTSKGFVPPTWRRDLESPIDLVEEVSRLYGFNNLTRTIPTGTIPIHEDALSPNYPRLIRNKVASLGYTETYASTMISVDHITSANLKPPGHLKVLHPMSSEYEYMRSDLIETTLPMIRHNLTHTSSIDIFELGTVFHKSESPSKLPVQPSNLIMASTTKTYAQTKGDLLNLVRMVNTTLSINPTTKNNQQPYLLPSQQASIQLNKKIIGSIGQLDPSLLPNASPIIFIINLDVSTLIAHSSLSQQYPSLPKHSPIIEDLTFKLPPKTYIGQILETLNKPKLVHTAALKDQFKQNFTFTIHYLDPKKQLTDKDVTPVRMSLIKDIESTFSAKLVGKI